MAEKGKLYECKICGQIVKVKKAGAGTLVCCGKPMVEKEGEE
ncbi:MAG: desulfoferrodoxin FeS4 iron-binding domain-containing protein [bacterium]|nr:desulfoferrodoxin FeS4 iron-binding domain-containing protein [bacterium]